jgi:hypothetical protein
MSIPRVRLQIVVFLLMALAFAPAVSALYVDNGDGTVTDNVTGLVWQQGDAQNDGGGLSWQASLEYCDTLSLAGHNDWRLPNVRELLSLVDFSRYSPAIDPLFDYSVPANGSPFAYYWSSSSRDDLVNAFVVEFLSRGGTEFQGKAYHDCSVRCVRGGGTVPAPPPLPVVTIKAVDARTAEPGSDKGQARVTRTGATTNSLAVYYTLRGTARNGTDYRKLSGKVVIPIGAKTATISVRAINDSLRESTEDVKIGLVKKLTYQVGSQASAKISIYDND